MKLLSRSGMPDLEKWAANCWGALLELDFYSHPWSLYEARFPDGVKIRSNDTPFLLYLSCLLLRSGGTFWKPDGPRLILMASTIWWLWSYSPSPYGLQGFTRAGIPNKNEVSAIWYPKYRISLTVPLSLQRCCAKDGRGLLMPLIRQAFRRRPIRLGSKFLDKHMAILTKKPRGSIEVEIKEAFDNHF